MSARRAKLIAYSTRVVVAIVVLAVGYGVFAALYFTRPAPPPLKTDVVRQQVRVFPARTVDVRRQWWGFGTAQAMDSANVPSRVTATVAVVPRAIVSGVRVNEGDELIYLDSTDFDHQLELLTERIADIDAQLEQLDIEKQSWATRLELATTETEIAERDLTRVRELFDSGDAKEVEVDRVLAQVSAAKRAETQTREELEKMGPRQLRLEAQKRTLEVERRIAQTNVDRTTITSPITGILEAVDVEKGEQVAAGQRVARVVNLDLIEVPIQLPASSRLYVRPGDDVVLESTGAAQSSWSGKVDRIAPDDDASRRTFDVYVMVEQSEASQPLLAPGQFVKATVTSGLVEQRTVVPRRSIAGDTLRLVVDGQVSMVTPEIAYYVKQRLPAAGIDREDYWAVLDQPLVTGTYVVIDGTMQLASGEEVDAVLYRNEESAVASDPDAHADSGAGGPVH